MKKRIIGLMAILVLISGQAFAAGYDFVKSDGANLLPAARTWTPSITCKASIQAFTFHYTAGGSSGEDIRINLDSELGATYDTVIASSDSVELVDWFWQPSNELIIQKDDNIRIWVEGTTASGESGTEAYTMTLRGECQ